MAVELLLINDGKKKRGKKMSKRRRDKYGRFLKTGKKHKKRRNETNPANEPATRRNEPNPKTKHRRSNPATESFLAFLNPRRRRNPSTIGVALSAVSGLGAGYAADKIMAYMEKKAIDAGNVFAPPIPPLAIKALAGLVIAGISFAMTRSPVSAIAAVAGTGAQAGIKIYMEREPAALPPPAAAPAAAPAAPAPTKKQKKVAAVTGGAQQVVGGAGAIIGGALGQIERQFALIERYDDLQLIEGSPEISAEISALPETQFGDLIEPEDAYLTEEFEQGDDLTDDEWDLIERIVE